MKLFVLPMLIAIAVSLVADIYIYKQLRRAQGAARKAATCAHIALAILLGAYAITVAVAPMLLSHLSATALASTLYAYGVIVAAKAIFTVISALMHVARPKSLRRYANATGTTIAALLIATAAWATFVTRYSLDVKEVTLSYADLPDAFNGYRMVQISDFHINSFGTDTTFVNEIVQTINSLHPDITLFTGDLVSSTATEAKPFIKSLSRLHAPDGVYSILGNHDYGDYHPFATDADRDADRATLRRYQQQAGWHLLRNETHVLHRGNDSIMLIGVENIGKPPFNTYGDLHKAYPNLNDSNFKILMSHTPTHWRSEVTSQSNIQLMLAGHTHAMQMMLHIFGKYISPSAMIYPEWHGLYDNGNNQRLYVNIGLGCIGMPARFGAAKPEITVITLKKSAQ